MSIPKLLAVGILSLLIGVVVTHSYYTYAVIPALQPTQQRFQEETLKKALFASREDRLKMIEEIARKETKELKVATTEEAYLEDVWNYYAQEFEKTYAIKVTHTGIDPSKVEEKIIAEKSSGAPGSMDVVYIWGTTVMHLLRADALWGPINPYVTATDAMPIDFAYSLGGGGTTKGYAFVWYPYVTAWVYDSRNVKPEELPKNPQELLDWAKAHPGKFSYCTPGSGGSGEYFVFWVLYHFVGSPKPFYKYDVKLWDTPEVKAAWDYLNELEKYVWHNTYFEGNFKGYELISSGELWLAPGWVDEVLYARRAGAIAPWIEVALKYKWDTFGGNYLAVPYNAPNKAAALLFLNFIMSKEMVQYIATHHYVYPVREDVWPMLTQDQVKQLGPTLEEIEAKATFELNNEYTDDITTQWENNVVKV